jgi:glutathionyl-hydroquinone reductase
LLYEPQAFTNKPTLFQYNKWVDDMMLTLKTIDEKLVSSPFLCGQKMTIGDIVVFNEISQFFEMTGLSPSHDDVV